MSDYTGLTDDREGTLSRSLELISELERALRLCDPRLAQAARDELLVVTKALRPSSTPPSLAAREWVYRAVLLWLHYHETGYPIRVTTDPAARLDFPVDFTPDEQSGNEVKQAAGRALGLASQVLRSIERQVDARAHVLRGRRIIAETLAAVVNGGGDPRRAAERLYEDLCGARSSHPVDLVISAAGLFFLVSDPETSENDRTSPRASSIEGALSSDAEPEHHLRRFPAFGPFDASLVGDATLGLLRRTLVERHDETTTDEDVRRTLERMIVLIPRKKTDELLMHDIWGHWWQGVLLDFGASFSEWERVREIPAWPHLVSSGAFQVVEGRTSLRTEFARRLVHSDLSGRLRAGIGAVLSEALADLIEFKYQLSRPLLPTTSLLRPSPLRLDLSLRDVHEVAATCRQPYDELSRSVAVREEIGRALRSAGYPERGFDSALRELAALVDAEMRCVLGDDPSPGPREGALRVSATQRTMLNLARLETELENALMPRAGSQESGASLSEVCSTSVDLLAICLGCAYEFDHEAGFWEAPELVASVIPRFVRSLAKELESPTTRDECA